MKFFLLIFSTLFILTINDNALFNEDILVKDFAGNEINLKNIKITKDTIMICTWSDWCGSCIKRLDYYKANKRYENYQIFAFANVSKEGSFEKEKIILNEHKWSFHIYYDNNNNLANFLFKKGYLKSNPLYKENKVRLEGIFMFVKNKFLCSSCDKYANPNMQKRIKK